MVREQRTLGIEMSRPKIGAVSYLNTKPLVEGLAQDAFDYEVVFDLPSRLADRLADRELDVALIPVIEAVSNPDYSIVSDACIACRGPVWSVKLMSRVPGSEIKTLSLDEGSRTSCALSRIILDQKFSVRPECQQLPIDAEWRNATTDAVLIIGDRAMKTAAPEFGFEWDLGETWCQMTGKPFVFAVWAAHRQSDLNRLNRVLSSARDRGMVELESIARDQAPHYGLSFQECLNYFQDHLHFDLGLAEKSGMELYFQSAAELSLISKPQRLQFYDCQTAG
jgi:chorismate dehydratase